MINLATAAKATLLVALFLPLAGVEQCTPPGPSDDLGCIIHPDDPACQGVDPTAAPTPTPEPGPPEDPMACLSACGGQADAVYVQCLNAGHNSDECRGPTDAFFAECVEDVCQEPCPDSGCEIPPVTCDEEPGCQGEAQAVLAACLAEGGADSECSNLQLHIYEGCMAQMCPTGAPPCEGEGCPYDPCPSGDCAPVGSGPSCDPQVDESCVPGCPAEDPTCSGPPPEGCPEGDPDCIPLPDPDPCPEGGGSCEPQGDPPPDPCANPDDPACI